MSNDTQETQLGSTRPRLPHPSIITQMQIERLKREDEEEHWISGEELYTEGSSDDDEDRRDSESIRNNNGESIRSNYSGHQSISHSKLSHHHYHRSQIRHNLKVKIDQTDSASKICTEEEQSTASSSDIAASDGAAGASGDHEEPVEEDNREICWRPKRDDNNHEKITSKLENSREIIDLKEFQFEYSDIVDSLSGLKTSLTPLTSSRNSDNDNSGNETDSDMIESALDGADIIIEDDDGSIFFNEYLDRWSEAVVSHDNIEREILRVAKFDACIEKIYDRVKKAREETLREQISNREELKKMQSLRAKESGMIAKNSNQFFVLCDSRECQSETITDEELGLKITPRIEEREELEDIESRESRREKLEKKLSQIENRKANFIERNKELASCAMGTLAITDEEKKRLHELLEDIDDEECSSTVAPTDKESATSTSFYSLVSTPYTIDKEADDLLKELTEKLSIINSETYRQSAKEEKEEEEEGKFLPQKEQIVFNSLRNLAESGSKEIYPISEEAVRKLIRDYHAEQEAIEFRNDSESNSCSTISEAPTIAQKLIRELIKEAKATMPLFQFKYQTDELREEDENEKNKSACT